jgi:MazG family protein
LFQIAFHCDIAEKDYGFTFDDVVQDVCDKMIFRHPHVFNTEKREGRSISTKEVKDNWEKIKSLEKNNTQDAERFFEDVPLSLPALTHATKVQKKASQLNFDWTNSAEVLSKINEEVKELCHACETNDKICIEEEFGDILFSLVNLGRKLDVDPEKSLGVSIKKFKKRISQSIKLIKAEKISDKHLTDKKLNEIWEHAKDLLNKNDI